MSSSILKWRWLDSNQWPMAYESTALPLSYIANSTIIIPIGDSGGKISDPILDRPFSQFGTTFHNDFAWWTTGEWSRLLGHIPRNPCHASEESAHSHKLIWNPFVLKSDMRSKQAAQWRRIFQNVQSQFSLSLKNRPICSWLPEMLSEEGKRAKLLLGYQ